MPTNWIVPQQTSLARVISQLVLNVTDANTGDVADPNAPVNTDGETRSKDTLQMFINIIRAAVTNAAKVPVAVTLNSVPPEAEIHALILTANSMTAAQPNMSQVIVTPTGMYSPFKDLVTAAMKWIQSVKDGAVVTYPSDPVGQDNVTAASSTNPLSNLGVNYGDGRGDAANYTTGIDKYGNSGFGVLDLSTDSDINP